MFVSKFFIGTIAILFVTIVINIVDEILRPRLGGIIWQRVIRRSVYMTFGIIIVIPLIFLNFD